MSSRRYVAAALVVLAALGTARAGDLEDAADLKAKGRLDDAAAKYRAAAAKDSNEAAVLGLSDTLRLLKRFDEAASAVDPALKKNAASVPLMLAKARALTDGADAAAAKRTIDVALRPEVVAKSAEARKWVGAALKVEPKSVSGRILDARLMRHERGEETADERKLLEAVVADAPNDAEANLQLGLLLFRAAARNNTDKALWAASEKCFRAAYAADPANGQALFDAAMCAAWQGRYDKQYLDDVEKAAELMPGSEDPLLRIEKYYAKDASKRIPVFMRLAAKRPDDADIVFHLALALNAMGRDEDGQKLIDDLRTKSPKSAYAALNVAQLQLAAGKKDASFATALEAASLCSGEADRQVYDRLDAILVKTTQFTPDQRDKLWTALVAAYPKEVQAPNNAGLWFRDVGRDPARCLAWFLKALAIAPEDVMVMNDVAIAYELSPTDPDLDRAEASFRQAVATAKKNGLDRPDRSKGYELAVDNLVKLLAGQKRAKDLAALAVELKDDPRSESIAQLAETLRR